MPSYVYLRIRSNFHLQIAQNSSTTYNIINSILILQNKKLKPSEVSDLPPNDITFKWQSLDQDS